MKTIAFNGVTYSCPFVNVLPPLDADERAELRADIAAHGVTYSVVVTDEDEVIDGHNRLEIAVELGLQAVPITVLAGLTAEQKLARAEDLNMHRRHLTRDQKRAVVARRLKADPTRSNRDIAAAAGVDHKTVGGVRAALAGIGEIPQMTATRGMDGRTRTTTRSPAKLHSQNPDATVHRRREAERADTPSDRNATGEAAAVPARWSEIKYFALSLQSRCADLVRAGRAKSSDRSTGEVRAVAVRVQWVLDEIHRWADRIDAGTSHPTTPEGAA